MKYIVYKTTNLVNNKIYIGVHKTENPDIFDGYLGNSIDRPTNYFIKHPVCVFHFAVRKYGYNNFSREILFTFDKLEDALNKEAEIVNIDFITKKDNYNTAIGGGYGQTYYPINQFDCKGNLVKHWNNMNEAARALCVSHTSINNAKLHKGSCCGYLWSTENTINVSEFSYHVGTITYMYDCNGYLVRQFESMTEAAKFINSKENAIYRAIKMCMKHKNYYWSNDLVEKYEPKTLNLRNKIIYLYDLEGKFVRELSIGEATKQFFNIKSYGCLKQAILNDKPYKGYQISLEYKECLPTVIEYKDNKAKKVGRYSLDGKLLEIYNTVKEPTKLYGSGVFRVLNSQQKSTKGFIFKYL